MIIRPSKTVPIDKPEAPLHHIYEFEVFQTREDVEAELPANIVEKVLPPPDPSRRLKYWIDPRYIGSEDDGEPVEYRVVATDPRTGAVLLGSDGKPRIRTFLISKFEAGRFNIPYAKTANEFPPESVASALRPVPVPVRDLHPDEELALSGPSGIVVVRNRKLADSQQKTPASGFTEEDRKLLRAIARALGVA